MNDKQQLAAMGEHIAEQEGQPMCMAKLVEELEAQVRGLKSANLSWQAEYEDVGSKCYEMEEKVRVMADLLRDARRYVSPLSCQEQYIPDVQSIVSRIDAVLACAPETKP